jgi:enamine deaminase RidA (YjgF/YER057c/UK114 family)
MNRTKKPRTAWLFCGRSIDQKRIDRIRLAEAARRRKRRGAVAPSATLPHAGTDAMIQRFDVGARMSEMAVHGNTVYLAGQIADDASQDIQGQTRQVLEAIDALLARAGSDRSRILMAQIFLVDLADFAGMNEVWDAWVPAGNAPPRATVQAALAKPEWKIEIVVTAAV